jgi:hypothetical protein
MENKQSAEEPHQRIISLLEENAALKDKLADELINFNDKILKLRAKNVELERQMNAMKVNHQKAVLDLQGTVKCYKEGTDLYKGYFRSPC